MDDLTIEDLKDIADRCFMGSVVEPVFFQREQDGIRYCQWLSSETVELYRREGNIICPFANHLANIGVDSELHPLCTRYSRQSKRE